MPQQTGKILEIRLEEIEKSRAKVINNQTPGPDDIPLEMVKIVIRKEPDIIRKIVNSLIPDGLFPSKWEIVKLLLLSTLTKNANYEQAYTPISLLDVTGKFYEHIVEARLGNDFEE